MTTSTRARRIRRWVGGHEVSKPSVIVASWSAERIGPRLIAAPQRGHAHVSTVGTSVEVGADATAGRTAPRRLRASATRAARQVFARNPVWRI
jgi:hypothetical protein